MICIKTILTWIQIVSGHPPEDLVLIVKAQHGLNRFQHLKNYSSPEQVYTSRHWEIPWGLNNIFLIHYRSAENSVFTSFESCKTFRTFFLSPVYGWGEKKKKTDIKYYWFNSFLRLQKWSSKCSFHIYHLIKLLCDTPRPDRGVMNVPEKGQKRSCILVCVYSSGNDHCYSISVLQITNDSWNSREN